MCFFQYIAGEALPGGIQEPAAGTGDLSLSSYLATIIYESDMTI
jgi:hypothetical protein